jgi:magnesium chelatase accessory protein
MDFLENGSGPAVLLLHGAPGAAWQFRSLASDLAGGHRVLAPDLPGYRRSAPLEGAYRLERVNELLEEALLERGVRELSVVGHSAGAYRALALAFSRRVRVRRLVLLGAIAGLDEATRAQFHGFASLLRGPPVDLRPIWLQRSFAPGFAEGHPAEAADALRVLAEAAPAILAAELDALAESEDLRPRLRALDAPLLLRVGKEDVATPPAWSEEIARLAPQATLEVVPGCGHMLFQEDAAGTAAAVLRGI